MDLAGGSIDAGTDNVTLTPNTIGTLIDLGGADVLSGTPLTLGLTDAELDRITAEVLRIGDANAGGITISAAIAPAGTDTLHLISGGGIEETAPGLTVANLAVEAGDMVSLYHNNYVQTLAIHTPTATANFRNNGDLAVGRWTGSRDRGGGWQTQLNVVDGDLTIQDTTAPIDVDSQGVVAFYLPTAATQLKVDSGAHIQTRRAGPNYITADRMEWSGTMDSGPGGGCVFVRPKTIEVSNLVR